MGQRRERGASSAVCPRQTPLAPLYAAVVKTDPLPHRYEACIVAHCQRSGTQYHSAFSSSGGMSAQCLLLGGLRVGTLGHCFPKLALVPSRGAPVCTVHGGQGDGVQQLLHLWQRGTQEIETNRGDCGAHRGKPDPPLLLLHYWAHAAMRTRTWPMRPVSVAKWVPPESVCRHGCRPRTGCRFLRSPSGARVHCTVGSLQRCEEEEEEDRLKQAQDRWVLQIPLSLVSRAARDAVPTWTSRPW